MVVLGALAVLGKKTRHRLFMFPTVGGNRISEASRLLEPPGGNPGGLIQSENYMEG